MVDVGCGIGGSSRYISSKFGCTANGVTLSPKQAARANVISQEKGYGDKLSFQVGKASKACMCIRDRALSCGQSACQLAVLTHMHANEGWHAGPASYSMPCTYMAIRTALHAALACTCAQASEHAAHDAVPSVLNQWLPACLLAGS